jgi:hypothetical protein
MVARDCFCIDGDEAEGHARATQGCYLKMDGLATDTIEQETPGL